MDKEKQGENEDQCLGEKGFRDFMGGYSATRRLLLLWMYAWEGFPPWAVLLLGWNNFTQRRELFQPGLRVPGSKLRGIIEGGFDVLK